MKRNRIFLLTIAIFCGVLGAYVGFKHSSQPQSAGVTQELFSLSLPDSEGKSQSLSAWKGKLLIVNFWAPWCAPCVEEMPELSALQTEVASQNIQIIGIGIDSFSNISAFARKYKIDYPLYVGEIGATDVTRKLGNKAGGLPFTLLISEDGNVLKTYLGRLDIKALKQDLANAKNPHKT